MHKTETKQERTFIDGLWFIGGYHITFAPNTSYAKRFYSVQKIQNCLQKEMQKTAQC